MEFDVVLAVFLKLKLDCVQFWREMRKREGKKRREIFEKNYGFC
jgi:hypothetical protein